MKLNFNDVCVVDPTYLGTTPFSFNIYEVLYSIGKTSLCGVKHGLEVKEIMPV